ncbi:MAG: hypothetical protein GC145_11915 [Caulobacter sp.]|nr:hypothetical protein [Caulobacter sp.]
MKKIIIAATAAAALMAAMPAAAQTYGHSRDGYRGDRAAQVYRGGPAVRAERRDDRRDWIQLRRIDQRQAQIARRIDVGLRQRALTYHEARILRTKLNQIERLERRYVRSNRDLTRAEARNLNIRLDQLTWELRYRLRA